jgi:uncharacterized protein (TIGR02246 family)
MQITTDVDAIAETIISLEHEALNTWNKGDVEGQLKFYADDVTYFDPITAMRLDGLPAVAEYFRTLWAGKVNIPRYEMLNPQVIAGTDLAILTYNLLNYVHADGGSEKTSTRWNSTQVYRRIGEQWRVVHVHWSFMKHPAFENMKPEG